jgi:hypothetical protein
MVCPVARLGHLPESGMCELSGCRTIGETNGRGELPEWLRNKPFGDEMSTLLLAIGVMAAVFVAVYAFR